MPSTDFFTCHSSSSLAPAVQKSPLQAGEAASVVGSVIRVKVFPSGWAVGSIACDFGDVSVNGNALVGLTEKKKYEFHGLVENHKTYGIQIKVDSVGLHIPSTDAGMSKFLIQNYKGIGKKAAEKIVLHFAKQPGGLELFRKQLLANPYAMDFSVAGVKRKTSMNASEGLKSVIYMDLATRLGGVELGDKLLRKIAAHFEEPASTEENPVEWAWATLTSNPYALIRDLDGYAFRTADIVARKVGFDLARVERTAALVTFAVSEGCNSTGHTYLTLEDFTAIIHRIDPWVDVPSAIESAVKLGEPLVIQDDRFYTETAFRAERELARNLVSRTQRHLRTQIHGGSVQEIMSGICEAEAAIGITLDESQRQCVFGVLTSFIPIHTITAGPGCGKTTIMEVVVHVLQGRTKLLNDPETHQTVEVPYKINFTAPTGKAAKVLSARIKRFGLSAATIYKLLGVRTKEDESSGNGYFEFGPDNLLDVDLLVVDETSMVDLALMQALLLAVPATAHIIFMGDKDQLPSVGPGSVLSDFLQLPFDHHRLNQTHRNDGGILDVVKQAGTGRVDLISRDDVDFHCALPEASADSIASVLAHYDRAIAANFGDFSKVGLLIARRKGDPLSPGWNTTYLNAVLRQRYNPESGKRVNINGVEGAVRACAGDRVFGTRHRVGDRVIIRKNLVLKKDGQSDSDVPEQVVNGDTGLIVEFSVSKGNLDCIHIQLDDGRLINFPAEHADVIDLAYATTVHTAQGSEYANIIFICVNGHSSFVHRGIVFTAFSRAKKHLTVIGEAAVIKSVVARRAPKRNSFLVNRFFHTLNKNPTARMPMRQSGF